MCLYGDWDKDWLAPENLVTEDLRGLLRKPMHLELRIIDTHPQWREKQ
jgi:hypothetical protein